MTQKGRSKTGIEGLDEILTGGFLTGVSVLLEGAPGAGKTNLGLQILYNGITMYDEPGILISFEQDPEQIYRDAMNLGMDFKPLHEAGKFAVVLASPMKLQETLAGVSSITKEEIEEEFQRVQPRRVLIDSISHFSRITNDPIKLREILLDMLGRFTTRGINAYLTKEIERAEDAPISFEEYLVDSSVRLYNLSSGGMGRNQRFIEIRKTRGQEHISGRHPMRFSSQGIEVFPHRRPQVESAEAAEAVEKTRIGTGVRGLDYLMHGGLVKASSTLLAGTAGAGKSTFARFFIKAGLDAGEPGMLVTLNESPRQMSTMFADMGVDVSKAVQENRLIIHYQSPVDMCLSELYLNIEKLIDEHGLKRIVIDSVSDFLPSIRDANRIRDYLYSFVRMFEGKGVTAVLTSEMEHVTGPLAMSDVNYAFVMDAVVYLGFVEIESQMRRVIMVLKQRGSDHETELRELILATDGPKVGAKFTGLSGVTGGVATGKYQVTIDELAQPLTFIRGFAEQIKSGKIPADKQSQILEKMIEQSDQMLDHLCKHFGIDREELTGKK